MYVSVLVCAGECWCLQRKWVSDPMKLELQTIVSYLIWVLEIKLWFLGKAVCDLNHWALSKPSLFSHTHTFIGIWATKSVHVCYWAPTGNRASVFGSPPLTRIKLIPRGHKMWGKKEVTGAKGLPSNWDNFIGRVIMVFHLPQGTQDRLLQLQPTTIP